MSCGNCNCNPLDKTLDELDDVEIGSKVVLVLAPESGNQAYKAYAGATADVVDGQKEYPDLYKSFTSNVSTINQEAFIWVRWDTSNPQYDGIENGAYMKSRFSLICGPGNKCCSTSSASKRTNNDGLSRCFKCGAATEKQLGFNNWYDICPVCKI